MKLNLYRAWVTPTDAITVVAESMETAAIKATRHAAKLVLQYGGEVNIRTIETVTHVDVL